MRTSVGKRPLQAADLYGLSWILGLDVSPDGKQVCYVAKSVHGDSQELDGYRHSLHLVDTDSERPVSRNLLPGLRARIRAPRWLADGRRIAFISDISGQDNVWSLDPATGDLVQVSQHQGGVREFAFSPDGRWLALVAATPEESPGCGEYVPGKYRVIRRLTYKSDGGGYWNGNRAHVYLMPCRNAPDAPMTQVTSGPFDHGSLDWSPCGQKLVTVSTRGENPDQEPFRHLFCLDMVLGEDDVVSTELRQVTQRAAAGAPAWSPCGNYIAFIGHDNSDDRATNTGLWVTSEKGDRLVNLTADVDRPVGDYVADDMNAEGSSCVPVWSKRGDRLYTLMTDRGCTRVIGVDFPGESAFETGSAVSNALSDPPADPFATTQFGVRPIVKRETRAFAFAYDGDLCLVTAESLSDNPGDLFVQSLDDSEESGPRRITALNDDLLSRVQVADPVPVAFEGSEGRTIEGWLLIPPAGKGPHPLVLHIHGGPHSAHSPAFNFELQHLASSGYAVLYLNPHGSHSYGRRINIGTRHDWGGKDYHDLMKGVNAVIDREDIDESRLGVAGGSYGGWMVNYIVTRTHRFRAAVAQRSSSNRVSTFLSSMVGFRHARWEAPGYPWEHPDYFTRISPVMRAGDVDTPLLLIHSEHDHLCPLMQAEEMFTALKAQGKEVELVVFLGESHHLPRVGRPSNRVERLCRTRDWFHKYV